MNKLSSFVLLITVLFLFPGTYATDYKKNGVYNGFKLIEKRFVKEVNAECLYFEHLKSGAKLFKIAADDNNKTFSIAFKTDPESDCGTPHIMEHSVLNGSKNFPVKSPFDILQKGSLNTFLNAFTGSDLTCFPFASINNKDYFNLLHIYLDAVFNPLFKTDLRILKQEGWHRELENADSNIIYKGVVYNEMKGAYSSPTRELSYQINKILFPDNGYRFTSGGYPSSIPKLTDEMFIAYHNKYYHPANSHIMLYGNGSLDEELKFIDQEYLSKYDKVEKPVSFPIQKSFSSMKEGAGYYPVTEGSNIENQTYLTLSFVAGLNTDRATTMGLNIIADLLVNQEAAPIRIALQEAGIGQDVSAYVDEIQQNVFKIVVQNANAADKDKFKKIVLEKMQELVKSGFDKKVIEGTINRTEFDLREGNDAQKGISYNFQILPGWFFAEDPYLTLEYEKPLSVVKTALTSNYLEKLVETELLNNNHSLVYVMEPKPGLDKENITAVENELKDYKNKLNTNEKELLVKNTNDLINYQKTEDSPAALKTMPLLTIKDINPKAEWLSVKEEKVNGVKLLVSEGFTNNAVYTRLLFDTKALPQELIPYASLLTSVLGKQNTKNYLYGELDNELNIHTGGFSTFLSSYLPEQDDNKIKVMLAVNLKTMNGKIDKGFDLLSEIINNTNLADTARLKNILIRLQAIIESQIKSNGLGYAQIRLASYFSNDGMIDELTQGVEFYWFLTDLVKNFDKKAVEITEKLTATAKYIFNKENLIATMTGGKGDVKKYKNSLAGFASKLKTEKLTPVVWKFNFENKNEGLLSPSKVQYVIKGYDFKKLGYKWNGKMNVLNQVISTDWLQTRLRVMGGAYGGFSSFSQTGVVNFNSYRDPNLKETIENYNAIPEYLDKLEMSDEDMTRYIIGTIGNLDSPLTPQQKGNRAARYYIENIKPADLQKERDEILNTKPEDLKLMSKMIKDIIAKDAICVYGSEQKILSEKDVFKNVVKIIQ